MPQPNPKEAVKIGVTFILQDRLRGYAWRGNIDEVCKAIIAAGFLPPDVWNSPHTVIKSFVALSERDTIMMATLPEEFGALIRSVRTLPTAGRVEVALQKPPGMIDAFVRYAASLGWGSEIEAVAKYDPKHLDVPDYNLRLTPLLWASAYGQAGVVRKLLRHGADPARPNALYWSAYDVARANGHHEVCDVLQRAAPAVMTNTLPDRLRAIGTRLDGDRIFQG
jgi:hypothetical protein